jgi:membrane-bound lytic murein transglycosylase A
VLERVAFDDLPGWPHERHVDALLAFRRSCREILDRGSGFQRAVRYGGSRSAWQEVCREALSERSGRDFFERHFLPFRVIDADRPSGLFTGYYEPEVEGSRMPGPGFHVPLYRRPSDLVAFPEEIRARTGLSFGRYRDGTPLAYLTREEIENGALSGSGLEILWLRDWADAYFIHIQGSGRVRLAEGGIARVTFDGKSGLPYSSIGSVLIESGLISREAMSMQAIRRWMAQQPDEARRVMWRNQSFVFFRETDMPDPELGAFGAQHVQLTPRRSLAVDRSEWMFGTPIWLDAPVPSEAPGGTSAFRRLLIAQDTGSAIRGTARGDVFWGHGAEAEFIAGHMNSPGTMTVLLPRPVAAELGLPS